MQDAEEERGIFVRFRMKTVLVHNKRTCTIQNSLLILTSPPPLIQLGVRYQGELTHAVRLLAH